MIIGYYTIPIKTIEPHQLPAGFKLEKDSYIDCGLKVAHILFIPIFPFDKSWILKKGQKSYRISGDVEKMLDRMYGRPRTPWYSYLGVFIALLFIGFYQVKTESKKKRIEAMSTARVEKQISLTQQQLQEPTLNDYYALLTTNGKYYGAKVDSISTDSLWLLHSKGDLGTRSATKDYILKNFILNKRPFLISPVSRQDLLDSYNEKKGKFGINGFAKNRVFYLTNIHRVDIEDEELSLLVTDKRTLERTESILRHFTQTASIDSSLLFLDAASKEFLIQLAKIAHKGNGFEMKTFIDKSEYPSVTYALMMYARYSYAKTVSDNFPTTDEELLKDFGFYTKLLDLGLWSFNEDVKNFKVKEGYMTRKGRYKLSISLYSNILDRPQSILFRAVFYNENGEWKLNLLSTFSYIKYQISKVGLRSGAKAYRQKIREEIKRLNPEVEFQPSMVY